MQKRSFIVIFLCAIITLFISAGAVWAADASDHNFTSEISWDKEAVFPGADVCVEVKYTNAGTAISQVVAPLEGSYNLVAILKVNDKIVSKTTALFGVNSALPPGLSRLFAGLGIYVFKTAFLPDQPEHTVTGFFV